MLQSEHCLASWIPFMNRTSPTQPFLCHGNILDQIDSPQSTNWRDRLCSDTSSSTNWEEIMVVRMAVDGMMLLSYWHNISQWGGGGGGGIPLMDMYIHAIATQHSESAPSKRLLGNQKNGNPNWICVSQSMCDIILGSHSAQIKRTCFSGCSSLEQLPLSVGSSRIDQADSPYMQLYIKCMPQGPYSASASPWTPITSSLQLHSLILTRWPSPSDKFYVLLYVGSSGMEEMSANFCTNLLTPKDVVWKSWHKLSSHIRRVKIASGQNQEKTTY